MNIKHVGILNAYDARNRGDRAIVEAQLGWIERTIPGASVTIFSNHHEYNRTIFNSASCELPLFGVPRKGIFIRRLIQPIVDIATHWLGKRTDSTSHKFNSCDAFFICGGGYLYSSPSPLASRQLLLHAANILAALKTGKPVLTFPLSWGPIRKKADELICKRLASSIPILFTRGTESDKLLASWGYGKKIISLPDVVIASAMLMPEVKVWRQTPQRIGSLGIAPIDWGFDRKVSPEDMEDYLSKLVTVGKDWCQRKGRFITIFPQVEVAGSDDDRIIARRLLTVLRDEGLPCQIAEDMGWSDYWKEISAQEAFVGCRMHSCIFAMVCGVPTIGLGYQPKFLELFEQLGWPDRSHSIDSFSPSAVAAQLQTLSTNHDKQEILKHIDQVGQHLIDAIDKAWLQTIAGCYPEKFKTSKKDLKISIVTPSYKQLDFLKCCAASVQDQEGDFWMEHLIQDGGTGREFTQWATKQKEAVCVSEPDDGMYDAINRGFRKSKGDIIAWLNCDEQYLPGTLERVANYFKAHPETDILIGDVILVDETMAPLAYRRATKPTVGHIRYSHLSTFSAATFVRRRVLDDGHYLKIRWKTIADAVWIEELLSAGYICDTISEPLAIFCMLGSNLGQSALLFEERLQWESELKSTNTFWKAYHVAEYRINRLMAGAYTARRLTVSAYLREGESRREKTSRISGRWSAGKSKAAQLKSDRDSAITGLTIRTRPTQFALFHAAYAIFISIYVDNLFVGDAAKGPPILIFSLMYLSFRSRVLDLAVISFLYFLTSLYVLRDKPIDLQMVRLITFAVGSVLAIFWTSGLRNLEEWIRSTVALIRKNPAPMILSDSKGKIILINRAACLFGNLEETSLLNRTIYAYNIDDSGKTNRLPIESWQERPPDKPVRLSVDPQGNTHCGDAEVFVVGRGRYRFYAFTLVHPSNQFA